ncbi:MAG TPA: hypothetical protein VF832_08585 [Longimicrobiales bacterium]
MRPGAWQCSILLAAAAAAACAHRSVQAPLPPPVTVRVLNETAAHAVIWVARDSAHWRLGAVDSAGRAEWPVPRSFLQQRDSVRFIAFRAADDASCIQDARFANRGRKRFTVVLRREFPNPAPGAKGMCRWP